MRLTLIVPAHNEQDRIGRMLDAYLPYFARRHGADAELIVVVNGTTDNTEQVVAAYQDRFPNLRIIVEPERIGKGGALMLGFRAARGEYVGFVDADGSTPPEAFQDLLDNIGQDGAIIASRWCKGAEVSPRQPLDRRVASRVFNWISRLLFGLKLTDTQCGAKLMRRDAMLAALPHLGITQWAFDVDLLFQLRRAGYSIREIPTVWRDVAGSKILVGRAALEMTLALIRLRLIYSPYRFMVSLYDRILGPILQPAGAERDHLVFHSVVLMAGAQAGNICNLLFQLAMVRMLSGAEYGVMAAMLGALMAFSTPFGALSGTATHFAARLAQAGRPDLVRVLMRRTMLAMTVPALLLAAAFLIGRPALVSYFQLGDNPWPLYVAAVAAITAPYGTIPGGVLMGLQAFAWATAIGNASTVLRLLLGLALVMLGAGAMGALSAHVLSGFVGLAATMIVCGRLLRGHQGDDVATAGDGVSPLAGAWQYLFGYMVAFAGFGVLSSADLVLIKHYFPAEQAGAFAKAALVARIMFFLPAPVATAMFPKVVSDGEASLNTGRTLTKAVLLMSVIMVGAGGFCLIFPGFMLRVLAGVADPALVPWVRGMVLALAPVTLISVLLTYEVAQRRFAVALPLGLCAAGYVAAVVWRHETPMQIIVALGVAGTAALASVVALLPWRDIRGVGKPSA